MKKKYFDFSRKATQEEKVWFVFELIFLIIICFPMLVAVVKKLF